MAEVFEQNGKKFWKNSEGDLIPISRIYPHEKKSEILVERVHNRVRRLQERLIAEKKRIGEDIDKYLKAVANDFGEEWEGNAKIFNFDKSKQIEVKNAKHLIADERMKIAETKIKNLIKKWAPGSNDKIIILVQIAFQLDAKGDYNIKKIYELRRVKIKDTEWNEAMEIAMDSISVDYSKIYFNFREKKEDGKLVAIPLNFSSL